MISNLEKKIEKKLSIIFHENNVKENIFAVGVSGGADSLALIYILNYWAKKHGKKLVALTVEHGLRKESLEEAEYVSHLMKKENIEHHILTWVGDKPKTGIEEAARHMRYNLIKEFCDKNNIKYLMIAHHKYDQAETFLMRLQRGSGVDGLSAMAEVSNLGSLEIIRPLLDVEPDCLKEYLRLKNIKWCDDKSNYDEGFLRVKIRNLLPYLNDKIGLSPDRIVSTAKVLSRTKDFLEKQVSSFIKNNVKFYDEKIAKISIMLLQKQHEEMVFRIMSQLLKDIGDKVYIPRAVDIQRIVDALLDKGKDFKNRTLGGCEIINYGGSIWIIPEIKNTAVLNKKDWEKFILDNPHYGKVKFPYKVRKFLKSIEF